MRTPLVKIRFSISGIALLFIKRSCLLLGVQADGVAARVSDLGFGGGKDPGTEMISAEFFFNGDPPDDIFSLCLFGEKPARGGGNLVYVQDKMNSVLVCFVEFIVKSLFFHKHFFSDLNGILV